MKQHYNFTTVLEDSSIPVTSSDLYSVNQGYGFYTEEIHSNSPILKLPELNTGFEVWDWLLGEKITTIKDSTYGCYIKDNGTIPLSFKCNVPKQGNYHVFITLKTSTCDGHNLMIFSGRRRLMEKSPHLPANSSFTYEYTINVCDIIPRGLETPVEDTTLDISILGTGIYLADFIVEPVSTPTLYIAGDSTVTDQSSCYPYDAGNSYCGWGQMLSFYLNKEIALSNHAHSGLTTESFRSEGHYDIIRKHIQPGDYVLFQFAHNDQKLSHLKASEGYQKNLITYINDIKTLHGLPLLVSPICRNSWKGNDGSYNDLLAEYADTCRALATQYRIPLLDLHKQSYKFITTHGLEDSKRYFYPGDYTHSNDYGAFIMAGFIADEMSNYNCLSSYLLPRNTTFTPPDKISKVRPPENLHYAPSAVTTMIPVEFTDLNTSIHSDLITSLTRAGLIPTRSKEFRPNDFITRVECLELIIKMVNFFPTNVYNDWFSDVVGHEWYAGIVECAYFNGLISDSSIVDGCFKPNSTVSYEELLTFAINGYKSRKSLPVLCVGNTDCSVIEIAKELDLFDSTIPLTHVLTRDEAIVIIGGFYDKLMTI